MLRACKYCGKIHSKDYICESKPVYNKTSFDEIYNFRNTQEWKNKRSHIKERDNYLCQACFNNLYGTRQRLTTTGLEVHHIKPIKSSWNLRLDENNLITLCRVHHELSEQGNISQKQLKEIVGMRCKAQN